MQSCIPTGVGSEQLRARWDALPEPARQYLRCAISGDVPTTRTARLKHDGFMRTAPNSRRSAEIDQGASLRWLAECVCFPYGFVGDSIQWEPFVFRPTS